jgi:predicted glycosyltransferase involved in capsule biosynthesis
MAAKINLDDVTFLIPLRIDTVVRLENLVMVVDFMMDHFNTHIHIVEAADYNNRFLNRLLPKEISVRFIEDHDPVFHRTKYINMLVSNCQTPLLAVWDTDVIVPPEQIVQSVECLRQQEAHFVYPYEEKFLETSDVLRELYLKTRNLNLFMNNIGKMRELYLPNPVGGGFFANRTAYIESGMENEHFYGWGREDGDRLNRWEILGYQIKRIPGPLFHLTHERGFNSSFHSSEQNHIKMSEIHRIASMSEKELKEEINNWQR